MADSSFDVVSKVDRQEVDNALNQAAKEISQRYDFKGVGASITWSGEAIQMEANSEERVKTVLDVFQSRLIKRGVSLKSLDVGEPQAFGKDYRLGATVKEGLSSEVAKKLAKTVRHVRTKGAKPSSPGEELRVSSKPRGARQSVTALLKETDVDAALQFGNYR